MFGPKRRSLGLRWGGLAGAAMALFVGCGGMTQPVRQPPVAQASIEVITLQASRPDTTSHATCQTGASIYLRATGSFDPAGQPLTFRWTDRVSGQPTEDFHPNPLVTSEIQAAAILASIGVHEVELEVRARDGRRAVRSLRVTVTSCEGCGVP